MSQGFSNNRLIGWPVALLRIAMANLMRMFAGASHVLGIDYFLAKKLPHIMLW